MGKARATHLDTMLTFLRQHLAYINMDEKPHNKWHRTHLPFRSFYLDSLAAKRNTHLTGLDFWVWATNDAVCSKIQSIIDTCDLCWPFRQRNFSGANYFMNQILGACIWHTFISDASTLNFLCAQKSCVQQANDAINTLASAVIVWNVMF